jgi:SPP1 family predicted phage head-tail adaptor
MIRAGSLNTPITIQRQVTTTDAIGQPLLTWTDYALVWASVRHLSGVESIKAGASVSTVQASMRVRWLAGIGAGMRVLAGGVVYEIRAVLPDMQRREYTDLVCELVS